MTRKITRRSFIKGLSVAGLGVTSAQLLAACAPAAPAPSAAPDAAGSDAAPAATDVVLRVQVPPEAGQSVMPTIMAQRYQDESGVEVIIEETIYTEIETKTQTGFISNTLQDLLYGHHRWLFINYLKGIYLDIDDLMASDPLPDFEDMYPSVMAGNSLDGKNFSVPGVVHPGGNIAISYNITMLEEKGLPLPQLGWTMQDWEELARAAADPENGIFGMGFDGMNSFHYYSNTARSFGDPGSRDSWVMNEDGTEFIFNTPLHEEIGNWYATILNDRIAPRKPDYIENAPGNVFVAGLMATHASTVGNVANFINRIDGAFEMDAVPLPVGPQGRQGTCYSGNQHMINSKTANAEQAYELLKMYSSGEAGVLMVLEGKLQPNGHKSAWTNAQVNEVNKMYGITDELLSAGIEPFPMPRNTRFTEANNAFLNDIDLVWEGEATWAEQAPIIVEKVQAVLDLDRP